eukprot:symbB.v1.2.000411.t1/scaffold30.1/size407774/27
MAADLSALLLVLLVCVTYASIAPLIILAGALFFALRWLVLALRYLYVHVPRFDSGGDFWYLLWNQAVLALILGDFTTLAAVALRSGYAQLPFLLPLPLLPVAFRAMANVRFSKPSQRLSLRVARMVDARADPNLSERFPLDAYWHPALRHPGADDRGDILGTVSIGVVGLWGSFATICQSKDTLPTIALEMALSMVYEAYSNVFEQLKVLEQVKLPSHPNARPKVKSKAKRNERSGWRRGGARSLGWQPSICSGQPEPRTTGHCACPDLWKPFESTTRVAFLGRDLVMSLLRHRGSSLR